MNDMYKTATDFEGELISLINLQIRKGTKTGVIVGVLEMAKLQIYSNIIREDKDDQ